MKILAIRTDKPEAELALYDDNKKIDEVFWQAHRKLSETIHLKINDLLDDNNLSMNELEGIVCYKGPGSFTGLRIGLTVANTIAQQLDIPIIGDTSSDWQKESTSALVGGQDQKIVMPEYGSEPHITKPKK